VRILRQNTEEMLFSFIISQNNMIPRIKAIIERTANALGEKHIFNGEEYHAFPTAKTPTHCILISIDYYNSYIATHTPRAIDYIGRALDFITTRDYDAAIADIGRALALTPDFAPAYMLRGQANYHKYELMGHDPDTSVDAVTRATLRTKKLNDALDDYNKAVELAPATAPAWFNKGNILIELEDYTSALASFTRAIELKDDMGEALFQPRLRLSQTRQPCRRHRRPEQSGRARHRGRLQPHQAHIKIICI